MSEYPFPQPTPKPRRWTKAQRERAREKYIDGIDLPLHSPNCEMRQAAVGARGYPPDVEDWYRRAVHARFCLDYSSGVMAEICQTCLRPIAGSPAGTGGRGTCFCGNEWVDHQDLARRHGIELVFPNDGMESSTGQVVGA